MPSYVVGLFHHRKLCNTFFLQVPVARKRQVQWKTTKEYKARFHQNSLDGRKSIEDILTLQQISSMDHCWVSNMDEFQFPQAIASEHRKSTNV